jgi:diguanylate cyclase (GGDEF)-like protein/PAS domain S-box-containing protein
MSSETNIRVLLISSDEMVLEELRDCLSAAGGRSFSTETAAGASESAVALRSGRFDLAVVDIAGGSADDLRELELVTATTADTAVLAATTTDDARIAIAALELGAQECLTRGSDDFDPDRLVRTIRNTLVRSAHDGSRPLATLIELSSDAILTMNRDMLVTRFNAAAERLYGIPSSEVIGGHARVLAPPEDYERQTAMVDRVLDGESIEAFEVERVMRDGRNVVLSMSGSPIVDAFGNVIEVSLIMRDVSDEVHTRQRLAEQQLLLESSQAAGRIGSWSVDRLTGRIEWSTEHYRLLRRDPSLGPATLKQLLDVVHPHDRDLVANSFGHERGFTFEARLIADPDDVRTLRVRGDYLPRPEGQPGRLLGITQDVTEERAEHAARRLAEEQLERAFDEALIGMAIMDPSDLMLRVNTALCEIFGRTQADLLATTFQALTHPDDIGDDQPVMLLLESRTLKHHVREKRYVHADGHTIWAEVAVSLMTEADGSSSHIVVQVQDITERRARFEQLRHMADHDPLTGLLNRRGFDRELDAHIARTRRYGATGALLMFDLDNFKAHNDTHGHSAGDELLVALADGLRNRLRTTDVLGRLGGDEFVVLLPDASRSRADLVTNSLVEHIQRIGEEAPTAVAAGVTASAGFVCFEIAGPLTPEAAMKCADAAMYTAKRKGRNQYTEWGP